jgi:hypothetical protein
MCLSVEMGGKCRNICRKTKRLNTSGMDGQALFWGSAGNALLAPGFWLLAVSYWLLAPTRQA